MIVVVTTRETIVGGTLRPSDIPCPLCNAKGGLEMRFLRTETCHSIFVVTKSKCNDAELHCAACGQDIPSAQWSGPLKAFMHTHLADFGGFSMRPSKILLGFLVFIAIGVAWDRYDRAQSAASGREYQTSGQTIRRAVTEAKPGMVWLVSYTRPEDVRANGASSTEWLVRVEKVEGGIITVRMHRSPPTERIPSLARSISGTEDSNFTGPQVTLQDMSRSGTMLRILSGVTTARNDPNMFVQRIVREQ